MHCSLFLLGLIFFICKVQIPAAKRFDYSVITPPPHGMEFVTPQTKNAKPQTRVVQQKLPFSTLGATTSSSSASTTTTSSTQEKQTAAKSVFGVGDKISFNAFSTRPLPSFDVPPSPIKPIRPTPTYLTHTNPNPTFTSTTTTPTTTTSTTTTSTPTTTSGTQLPFAAAYTAPTTAPTTTATTTSTAPAHVPHVTAEGKRPILPDALTFSHQWWWNQLQEMHRHMEDIAASGM